MTNTEIILGKISFHDDFCLVVGGIFVPYVI